jgi:hypothetical protein
MEGEEKQKPFPSLSTLPWKASQKTASFPHSHSFGDYLGFPFSPSWFNFNFDEKCYLHARYLLLPTCPFAHAETRFLSAFLALAPRTSPKKDQGLKPGFLLGLYGPTESRALIQSIGAVTREKLDPCMAQTGYLKNLIWTGLSD